MNLRWRWVLLLRLEHLVAKREAVVRDVDLLRASIQLSILCPPELERMVRFVLPRSWIFVNFEDQSLLRFGLSEACDVS